MTVTDEMKEELTKQMAVFWGHVVAGTTPDPQTVQECKLVYAQQTDSIAWADRDAEQIAAQLKLTKQRIKELEEAEEAMTVAIQNRMRSCGELVTVDGNILATWKESKPTKRFNPKLFQQSQPETYEKFCVEQPGSRRFLVK
jgi:hypothetical protein